MARHNTSAVLDGPAPEPAPEAEAKTWGDWVRFVLRGIGQTLITGGLVVLLFVVYEVYVTNYLAHEAQAKVHKQLIQAWQDGDPLELPGGSTPDLPLGVGIANLYIPRLGRDYAFTIVEGTGFDNLEKGPGHYRHTALPGKVGNFAIAGHRVGKGEPFLNLDHLHAGDAVIVETESHWYVYDVLGDAATNNLSAKGPLGIPGREIVGPDDRGPLYPVPEHPTEQPTKALLTMTTCHPKFTAEKRMIVYGKLVDTYDKASAEAPMPAAVTDLYNGVA